MVFDFYGPDIPQSEIFAAARTDPRNVGTYDFDMVRAAHFSNMSISEGNWGWHYFNGYSARSLGYAAFECRGMNIDDLKSIMLAGYPVVVETAEHFRVAVGFDDNNIISQDPLYGSMFNLSYKDFDLDWSGSGHWALLVSPWKVSVPEARGVAPGEDLNLTATVTYPCVKPFAKDQFIASGATATITLPGGLSLLPKEVAVKILGSGVLAPGESANVTWTVQAQTTGDYSISVEAEGNINGSVPSIPYYSGYNYEDRIGGSNQTNVEVTNAVALEFMPSLLNLASQRGSVECNIELNRAQSYSDLNTSSVMLNGTILLDPLFATLTERYENGSLRGLIVGFKRSDVCTYVLSSGERTGNVTFVMTFKLLDGTLFAGSGTIDVRMPGDINVDGRVDGRDLALAARAFGSYDSDILCPGSPPHPNWNAAADENEDGKIDAYDLGLIARNFGKTYE
jgi:hypothetical protein